MKIIWYRGARSNQIFHCALYYILKKRYPNEKIYGYYHQNFKTDVQDFYELEIPPKNLLSEIIGHILVKYREMNWLQKYRSTDTKIDYDAFFFDGYWQNKDIFSELGDNWLTYKNVDHLSEKNQHIINLMENTNSVAVHVRRGDYLLAKEVYGDTQEDYFKRAIEYGKQKMQNSVFFFFSDDIEWVKSNLIGNKGNDYYIDWNTGLDSYLDMYLMSKAKANIIANSTFSYWAAYFGHKEFVVYPKQWFAKSTNRPNPNLFPADWVAM